MLNFKLTRFDNGLKLITAPMEQTKAVAVLFLIGVGSRYEDKEKNGLSHFLEHMFFKGTEKRPTTLDIAKDLDAVGASYNAFTGEEHTGFFVRSASEHFDLSLDILNDMLYNSKFDEKEIEKEKGVIKEEINMYQDTPQSYVSEVAKKLFYGDTPLGREIAGEKETVSKFTQKDFLDYRDTHYQPKNMIIAVAGGNSANWEEKISKIFKTKPSKEKSVCEKAKDTQEKPGLSIFHKTSDQAHLVMGFRTIPRIDARRPILRILNNLFGDYMSSRLFTEVREKRGLAYYVGSDVADFQDAGAFVASAGVDINRADEAIKVILDEFNKLKTSAVSDEELMRAKENFKGKMYLSLEESFSVADFIAEQELFWGRIDDPEKIIKENDAVTKEDIKKFANEFFVPKNLNLAMIGPFKEEEKFSKILGEF